MAQSVETGFIRPVASTETYVVSTTKVEEWLQRQVNATAALAKSKGENVPPVNLTLFTLRASETFHPFVIMLPEEALVKQNRNDEEEMSIFNPESSQNFSRFLPHIWKVVQNFMYNKDDKKAFRSNEWRRALGLAGTTSQYLSTVVFPRSEEKNGVKFTIMLLDPLRIFYAMAREAGDQWKTDFQIEITKTERNQGTDYSYTFNKVPKDPKKKKGKDIVSDIERMMLVAARRGTK